MKFLAQTMAVLHTPADRKMHTGFCFERLTYSYGVAGNRITLKIEAENPVDWWCSDVHMLMVGSQYQVSNVWFKGVHLYTFDNLTQQDLDLVEARGVIAYEFCDSA